MTNRKSYRVGLVGAGYVSEFHIKALKRLSNVRIVGITDLDAARARATAHSFGITSHASLKVMAAEGLDVVHVLTPPDSHVDVALEALSLGCHVLVEKPLATNVEDCDRLIAESQSRNLRVCVNHSLLGDPLIKRARKLVEAGAIGDVLAVDYLRSSNYPPYCGGPLPPHYREGGYQFRDLGVHALYLLREFLGDIEDIQANFHTSGLKSSDPNIHFDEWRALVRCAKGTGNIQLSWNVKPLQHQLIIQGTRGTLHADLFAMYLTRRRHTRLPKAAERVTNALAESGSSSAQLIWNAIAFAVGDLQPYQGLHNFVAAFYDSLTTNNVMPAGLEQAREVVYWTEHVAREADHAKAEFYAQFQPGSQPAVVVTGANGLLGRAFVQRLIDEDEYVRLFVRRLPPPEIADHPQVEVVLGELGDPDAVDRAIEGATAVFHIGAAMNGNWAAHEAGTIAGTRNVVEACLKHKVPKVIYISSLSVIDWAGHPANEPVTESATLEPTPQRRGSYTQAKLEAERIVRAAAQEHGLPVVILRPGQIWNDTSPLITAAVGIRLGQWLVVIGDDSNQLPLVHVDDVVEAIVLATQSPFSHGEVFQIVDNELLSRNELLRLYSRTREPKLRVTGIPLGVACFFAGAVDWVTTTLGRPAPISPYRLRSAVAPLVFDCSKARDQLHWEPRGHTRDALRKMLTAQ
ncbi:MAG TPA: NAD-dependent epimerase/dehydratase family protein [Verrucomicrobiae bacterium]|nr:NAD-dependent epimerase/dehydratase family protein [Verrucomicrobiae bacterium]